MAAVSPMNFVSRPSSRTANSGSASSVARTDADIVLPVPGGPTKQQLARGLEAVRSQLGALALLPEHSIERAADRQVDRHVRVGAPSGNSQ